MKLINSKNNKSLIFSNAQSPCAIIRINPIGPCIYLLIGFNNYFGPLVNMEGATSISTILLVDVDVESFSSYKYVPTPWANHTKITVRGAPSLGNPSCSKLDFSPPVAVAAALPDVVDPLSTARKPKVSSPSSPLIPYALGSSNRGL